MKLQDQLDAFKAAFEAGQLPFKLSPSDHELLRQGIDELISTEMANNALSVGDRAPEFTLPDSLGNPVSSRQLLAQGPLVISFYRGGWCPYCNMDLQALQAVLPELRNRHTNLVAISPQLPVNGQQMQQAHGLAFPLLTDSGNSLAAQFGLRFVLADDLVELYTDSLGIDLTKLNDESGWTLPMPARFVVAPSGDIIYAQVKPDYTQRADPWALVSLLKG
jgi:peroxiredoxin